MRPATSTRFTRAGLAAVWCARPEFQAWLGVTTQDAARIRIYELCSITSRAELDRDDAAAKAFDQHIRRPYAAHLEQRG